MADTKVTSIRADEETTQRFKELAEQYPNSAECLKALINAHEMATAKGVLAGQETNISDFQSHLDSIMRGYIIALDMTANAENRIRQEFELQLTDNAQRIAELKERANQAKQDKQTAEEQATAVKAEMSALTEQTAIQLASLNAELDSTKQALQTAGEQIKDKQALLDEYRTRLEKAEQDVARLPELENIATSSQDELKASEQKVARLTAELDKKTADFDSEKKTLQEKAEVAKEKAVLQAKQELQDKFNAKIDKQNDKIQAQSDKINELYTEIDRLRQVIAELRAGQTQV